MNSFVLNAIGPLIFWGGSLESFGQMNMKLKIIHMFIQNILLSVNYLLSDRQSPREKT